MIAIKTLTMRLAFQRLNQPILSHMLRTPSRRTRALDKKAGFRPGRSGACEARLFRFTGQGNGEAGPPVHQVAACDVHEAMVYMRKCVIRTWISCALSSWPSSRSCPGRR